MRIRYPRLSNAVLNLLALHSLKAVARKSPVWINGARTGWVFDVYVDKPQSPHPQRPPAIFGAMANDSLETWIKQVERHTATQVFFEGVDWGSTETRVMTWMDESGELGHVDLKTLYGTYGSKSK